MKTSAKKNSAFTLIEMIGVLAIIGILAAVVAPRVIESIRDAKVTSAISSVNAAKTASLNYYQRYDRIPLDGTVTPDNNRPGASPTAEPDKNTAGKDQTFGQILYYQELLIEDIKAAIGESSTSEDYAIGCTSTQSGECNAGGGTAKYGPATTEFVFKSAGNATRVVYYYLPNLTKQEAAALGTKVNGPFPVGVQGEDAIIEETTLGSAASNIEGGNCWFSEAGTDGTVDAYLYVAHQ
jgi:prepilin-type N-terminal cleavage/methylation domain-containing protein